MARNIQEMTGRDFDTLPEVATAVGAERDAWWNKGQSVHRNNVGSP
jgi:hypothetical protein